MIRFLNFIKEWQVLMLYILIDLSYLISFQWVIDRVINISAIQKSARVIEVRYLVSYDWFANRLRHIVAVEKCIKAIEEVNALQDLLPRAAIGFFVLMITPPEKFCPQRRTRAVRDKCCKLEPASNGPDKSGLYFLGKIKIKKRLSGEMEINNLFLSPWLDK